MPVGRHLYACYLNNRWLTEEIEFDTMTVRFAGFVLGHNEYCPGHVWIAILTMYVVRRSPVWQKPQVACWGTQHAPLPH